MTRSTIVLSTATLLLATSNVFARIGETEEQIEKRYGKPVRTLSQPNEPLERLYVFAGMNVIVTFINNVSQREFYSKKDKSTLSDTEIEVLLAANSAGSEWIEDPVARMAGGKGWKLNSGERTAMCHVPAKALGIWAAEGEKITKEREAKAAKEKLNGF